MASIDITGLTSTSYASAVAAVVTASVFGYDTSYSWRVDAVNQFGLTTGDTWTFNSVVFDPPMSSWENLPGKTLGPLTGGTEGVDYQFTGLNVTNTVSFLVAACRGAIYYMRT